MAKNLVIVESPAKAKTIEKFLGKDYEVKSSFGHIRDLPKKGLNIDIANGFEPNYEISLDKKKVVAELKKAANGAEVWLASDEDREGEAIAWHLTQALKLGPLKDQAHRLPRNHQIGHRCRHPKASNCRYQISRCPTSSAYPRPPSRLRIITCVMEKGTHWPQRRPCSIGGRAPNRRA